MAVFTNKDFAADNEAIESDDGFSEAPYLLPSERTSDTVYEHKARLLNTAIQDIGFGKYQLQLFFMIGFGWASDNLWPAVTSLILTPITNEFSPSQPPLLTLSENIGLLAGAVFWGLGCDIWGRKTAFNLTLGITGVFGLVSASSPNFAAIGAFASLWSFGVGGNLPVDSAIFLEFLPGSHQWLLTALSINWAFARLVATLVAWPLLSNYTCEQGGPSCTRSENMGWRYFVIAMGGLMMAMFFLRFVCFTIYESPKYLMGKGRDEDAVKVVHEVARRNNRSTLLSITDLQACETVRGNQQSAGVVTAVGRNLRKFTFAHVRALFATRSSAISTSMLITTWGLIGLAFPLYNAYLPFLLASRGAQFGDGSTYTTYRNTAIISALGVPGALIGAAMVEIRRFGRKGALGLATILTGCFLFGSTTATNSNALLGWNCAWNLMSNIMYAVLYGFTPEVFPTKDRGTGNALAASANRIFGIMAPVIAIYGDLSTTVPVYVSGALFIVAGLIVVCLPFESQGKAAL